MCPACMTTLALATAGSTAAGGASALVIRRFINRRARLPNAPQRKEH
jgi:nitrate reductase gamma subunit